MGAILDKAAITQLATELKPMIDGAVEKGVKVGMAAELKPYVDRITDLETKTRERPVSGLGVVETSEDGRKFVRGFGVQPLYGNNRYEGAIGIPNLTDKDLSSFRFIGILRGLRSNRWDGFGLEKEVFDEVGRQKAALQLGDDSAAGFYIPNEVMATIIDPLRASSVKAQLGMQMMTGLTASPIEFPRQVGVETAYMVGEDTTITHSNQTADLISLSPHMAAVLTSASASLMQKAPTVVEGRIRRSIVRTLELKEDAQLFEGTGIGANILGIDNIAGILTHSFAGVDSSTIWEFLQRMIRKLEVNNVEITGGKFVMHASAWHALWAFQIARIAAGNNITFLSITPNANGVPTKTLFGYPVVICNTLTASTTTIIKFVNWPEVMWASWLNPGIAYSDSADDAFKNVKGYFRIVEEFDMAVEHPEVICTGTAFTF